MDNINMDKDADANMDSYQNSASTSSYRQQFRPLKRQNSIRLSIQKAVTVGLDDLDVWDDVEDYVEGRMSKGGSASDEVMAEMLEDKSLLFFSMVQYKAPFKLMQRLFNLCGDKVESICSSSTCTDTGNESIDTYLLHEACRAHNDPKVVQMIFDAYPYAINLMDKNGMTPVNIAYERDVDDDGAAIFFTVMKLFIDNVPKDERWDTFCLVDREHYLKMIKFASEIDHDQFELLDVAKYCLKDFITEQSKLSEPLIGISDLIRAPNRFHDDIASLTWVQKTLNEKICYPFYSMIIFLDMICQVILIRLYRTSAYESVQGIVPSIAHIYIMLGIVFYYFTRELSQVMDLHKHGNLSFSHYDAWNIADIFRIICVAGSCVLFVRVDTTVAMMASQTDPDGYFKALIVLTTVVLWVSVLNLLKNLFLNFAVFVHSLLLIVQSLVPFISALVLVLIAFSQSFFTIYQGTQTCEDLEDDEYANNFCTMSDSYLKIYDMMLNPYMTDFDSYSGKFLFVLFTLIVVISLLNVLIGIICNTYDNAIESGSSVFWINRLGTVHELDGLYETITGAIKPLVNFIMKPCKMLDLLDSEKRRTLNPAQFGGGRAMWNILMVSFEDVRFNRLKRRALATKYENGGMFMYIDHQFTSHHNPPILTRIIGVMVIPIWLFLGTVTLGILWPPQVRAAILCPKVGYIRDSSQHESVDMDSLRTDKALDNVDRKLNTLIKAQNDVSKSIAVQESICTKTDLMHGLVEVKKQINSLDGTMSENHSKSSMVVENIGNLNYEISTFKEAVIANVLMKLSTLESSIDDIAESTEANEEKIGKEVDSLRNDVSNVKEDIATLVAGMNTLLKLSATMKSSDE